MYIVLYKSDYCDICGEPSKTREQQSSNIGWDWMSPKYDDKCHPVLDDIEHV